MVVMEKMNIFWLTLVLMAGVPVVADICPKVDRDSSGEPRFTKDLGSLDYVGIQKSISVLCCATNFHNITWFRQRGDSWESFPPQSEGDSTAPTLIENGQVLRIMQAGMDDNTSFRCDLIKDSRIVKHHDMRLSVMPCDTLTRGPYLVPPLPLDHTIHHLGGNITFYCTGYFGCSVTGFKIVEWHIEGHRWENVTNISKRYTTRSQDSNYIRSSELTISPIQREDLDRTFICFLSSDQIIHPTTKQSVHIRLQVDPDVPSIIGVSVGAVVGTVVVITLLTCFIKRCYGPQIRLYAASRLFLFAPKTITDKKITHNVFIYHAEEEQEKAEQIKQKLVDKNYNVYMSSDVMGNEYKLAVYERESSKSAVVVFLYSKNLLVDPFADHFLQCLINEHLINERHGKGILFLEIDSYEPNEVMDWTKNAKNKKVVEGQKEMNDADGINKEDNDNDVHDVNVKLLDDEQGESVDNANQNTVLDLKFWKTLPRYKVPSEDASGRKQKNFWCSLQNKIPKFDYQLQARETKSSKSSLEKAAKERNSSSVKPLMEIPPVSPNCIVNEAAEFSPNTDSVFKYDNPTAEGNNAGQQAYAVRTPNQNADVNIEDQGHFQGQGYNYQYNGNSEESLIGGKNIEIVNVDVHMHEPDDRNIADDTIAKRRESRNGENEMTVINMSEIESTGERTSSLSERHVFELSGDQAVVLQNSTSPTTEDPSPPKSARSLGDRSEAESGYSESQSSASGHGELSPQSSLSDKELKSHSSGFSESHSETLFQNHISNQNGHHHANPNPIAETATHNGGALHVDIGPQNTNFTSASHSSPESGYITSPSETNLSTESDNNKGPFVKQMDHAMENRALV